MNLYFRMIILIIASFFKPRLPVVKPTNSLKLRVLPNDIDLNFHMNNGRYLTMCDLVAIDMFIRTGLAKTFIKEKWVPLISGHTIKYKRPLNLLQPYILTMEVVGWDHKAFTMQHTFRVKGKIAARVTTQGVITSRSGIVPPEEAMTALKDRLGAKKS